MTIEVWVELCVDRLKERYADAQYARNIAWWLLEAATHKKRTDLIAHDHTLTPDERALLHQWLDEHVIAHKPLQYMIGWVPFADLEIGVKPPTLIPRSETEEWCLALIQTIRDAQIETFTMLDLCTGSGCVALAFAKAFPKAQIIGSDIDEFAITLAQENKRRNNIANVTFVQSDLFAAFKDKRFDIIIANPPYIAHQEWQTLDASVTNWEDPKALVADDHGLALIKKIIQHAPTHLRMHAWASVPTLPNVALEIGYRQGPSVCDYMKEHGYTNVQIHKDYADHDRLVWGRVNNEVGAAHNS